MTQSPPRTRGDGFLMRLGYTVVDAGWQGDVAPGNSRLFPDFPIPVQAEMAAPSWNVSASSTATAPSPRAARSP